MAVLNVRHDGLELFFDRTKDLVLQILSNHGPMGRNNNRFKAVDLLKLKSFGVCCTCHAAKLGVHAEIVLKGNGSKRLVLGLNGHTLFGLDSLMQSIGPAPACHESAGELIDNNHLAALDHVLLIFEVEGMGPKGGHEVMQQANVRGVVKAGTLGKQAHLA